MAAANAAVAALTMRDALAALRQGDHETALRIWREFAATGHSGAHNFIGKAYAEGRGVPQDFDEADRWFDRYVALYKPGVSFLENRTLKVAEYYDKFLKPAPVSWERARAWYERAAAEGSTFALWRLGGMHRMGEGVPKNPQKALAYYRRAIAAGNILAYRDIIELHLSDEAAAVDFAPIHEDLSARAGNGDAKSAYVLGRLHVNGVGVEKDPRRARAWWETSARLGYDKAALALAGLAMVGELREGDWRMDTLKWMMLVFGGDRDEWAASALSNRYRFEPYGEDEIRAARQAAEAFLEANPAFPRRDAPPE